jgi:hypothetical protein
MPALPMKPFVCAIGLGVVLLILAVAEQASAMPPLLSYDRWVITPHGFPDVDSPLIQAWETNTSLPRDTVEISSPYVKQDGDFWKEKPSGKLPEDVPARFHYVPVRVVQQHDGKLEFLGWLWMMSEVVDFYHGDDAHKHQMIQQQMSQTGLPKGWTPAPTPTCRWVVNPDLPRDTVELLSCDGNPFVLTEKDSSWEVMKSLGSKRTLIVRVVQRQSENGKLKYLGFRPFNAEAVRLLHGDGAPAGKIVVEEIVDNRHPERFRVEP